MPCRPSVLPNSMSIGLCRFCVELRPEREDLAARGLALLQEHRQQILEIVGARGAGRRQHAAELDIEQRRLDVVQRLAGVRRQRREPLRPARQRRQHRMADQRVDHPERDVRAGLRLHVHRDAPRLPAVLQHANLQVRAGRVVLALEPIGTPAQHAVEKWP